MTRPKVPDDRRQRTAQACDTCKRRKQKCNGTNPCATCTKKGLKCDYTANNSLEHSYRASGTQKKRQKLLERATKGLKQEVVHEGAVMPYMALSPIINSAKLERDLSEASTGLIVASSGPAKEEAPEHAVLSLHKGVEKDEPVTDTSPNKHDEGRLLQDPTGRLLYVGDSATLSFLQFTRLLVSCCIGKSNFTEDPKRHTIVEQSATFPLCMVVHSDIPDVMAAKELVQLYYTQTHGIIEIFDREWFLSSMEHLYRHPDPDPTSSDNTFLSIFYLVLAIGLVMTKSNPNPKTPAEIAVQNLKCQGDEFAEDLVRRARRLADPKSGLEDSGFGSVQILSLMTIYMLTISRRNAAYVYYGMSVRSAMAIGLHRYVNGENLIYRPQELIDRRNLWRSLFILDRFLALSLGRPGAISENDCSAVTLEGHLTPDNAPNPPMKDPETRSPQSATKLAVPQHLALIEQSLNASVQCCKVSGRAVKKIYAKRKITKSVAREFVRQSARWVASVPPKLHYKASLDEIEPIDSSRGMAILNVNLFHSHSVILSCRPFFMNEFKKRMTHLHSRDKTTTRSGSDTQKFVELCVVMSAHTVDLVHTAFKAKHLSQRNHFVMYFFFAAALVILSNEIASIYQNESYHDSLAKMMEVIQFCAEADSQANRLKHILEAFEKAVTSHKNSTLWSQMMPPAGKIPSQSTIRSFIDPVFAVMPDSYILEKDNNPLKSTTSPKMKLENPFVATISLDGSACHSYASSYVGTDLSDTATSETTLEFENLWRLPSQEDDLVSGIRQENYQFLEHPIMTELGLGGDSEMSAHQRLDMQFGHDMALLEAIYSA